MFITHVHNPCSLPEAKIQTKKNKVKGNKPQIKTLFPTIQSKKHTLHCVLGAAKSKLWTAARKEMFPEARPLRLLCFPGKFNSRHQKLHSQLTFLTVN